MKFHPMVGYLMAQVAGMPGAAESPARQAQAEAFADALKPPPKWDWTGIPDGYNKAQEAERRRKRMKTAAYERPSVGTLAGRLGP